MMDRAIPPTRRVPARYGECVRQPPCRPGKPRPDQPIRLRSSALAYRRRGRTTRHPRRAGRESRRSTCRMTHHGRNRRADESVQLSCPAPKPPDGAPSRVPSAFPGHRPYFLLALRGPTALPLPGVTFFTLTTRPPFFPPPGTTSMVSETVLVVKVPPFEPLMGTFGKENHKT